MRFCDGHRGQIRHLADRSRPIPKKKSCENIITLRAIRTIFGPPPTKISKTVNDGTSSEDSILPSSDSFGDSSTSSHADRGLALTEKDDNTECILSQLQALHLKIDRLEKQDTRNNIIVNTTDLSSVLKPKNVIEILVNCRSVEIMLSLLPFFTIKNDLDAVLPGL